MVGKWCSRLGASWTLNQGVVLAKDVISEGIIHSSGYMQGQSTLLLGLRRRIRSLCVSGRGGWVKGTFRMHWTCLRVRVSRSLVMAILSSCNFTLRLIPYPLDNKVKMIKDVDDLFIFITLFHIKWNGNFIHFTWNVFVISLFLCWTMQLGWIDWVDD